MVNKIISNNRKAINHYQEVIELAQTVMSYELRLKSKAYNALVAKADRCARKIAKYLT
jgi:hypothetical protein